MSKELEILKDKLMAASINQEVAASYKPGFLENTTKIDAQYQQAYETRRKISLEMTEKFGAVGAMESEAIQIEAKRFVKKL